MSQYFDSPEFQEILHRYERAARSGRSTYFDVQEYIDLADYYSEAGDNDEAVRLLNEGLKRYPDDTELIASKTGLFIDLGRYKQARQLLEQLEPDDDRDYYFLHAQLALALDNDPETAETDFNAWTELIRKLTQEELDDDLCGEEDAQDYLRNGIYHVAAAYAHLRPAECRQQMRAWITRYLQQFNELGDYEADELMEDLCNDTACCDLLEEIVRRFLQKDPYRPNGWQHMAMAQMMNQHPEEAIESAEFALAINPDDRIALDIKAEAFFELRNFEQALPLFLQVLSPGLGDLHPLHACGIALHTAICFIARDSNQEAIPYIDLAIRCLNTIRSGPKHPQANAIASRAFHIALACTGCNLYAKALKIIKKAVRCAPDNVECQILQRAIEFILRDDANVEELITDLMKQPERLAYSLCTMANHLCGNSCFDAARRCLEFLLNREKTGFFVRHPQDTNIETFNEPEVDYGGTLAFLAYICFHQRDRRAMLRYLKQAMDEAPGQVMRYFQSIVPDTVPLDDYADYLSTRI